MLVIALSLMLWWHFGWPFGLGFLFVAVMIEARLRRRLNRVNRGSAS
jgi:hypothetical protein